MKLTILGSGTSHGIPVLGCDCPVCHSEDILDKRMRASLYIEGDSGERALIDTGPEFRLQAIRAGIKRLDGIFLTHAHADHVHGLDDVRPLSRETPLPVYGNRETIEEMRERFSYIFKETQQGGGKPRIIPRVVSKPVALGGLTFTPIPVKHGMLDILGWKIEEKTADTGTAAAKKTSGVEAAPGAAVYLTDTSEIPAASREIIGKPAVLIIGALRTRPAETHFSFEQALNAAVEIGAAEVYLTHICHDYLHGEIVEYCQNFMEERGLKAANGMGGGVTMTPAYDCLEITL
ncbi:MBL fold metallo-hydrolase [Spirochaetia bacterium]|nr:MBL fold metallo-hydrolase [Spirochaetia bacterium]